MDHESELTADVIAAIDACRHDSDDRHLPEVASVLAHVSSPQVADYGRSIERVDRAVAGAMQEVPVPSGLADRILAGIRADSLAFPTLSNIEPDPVVLGDAGTRRRSRRFVLSAALAMAASVLVALVLWGTRERLDEGDLRAQAKAFYGNDDHSAPFSDKAWPVTPPVASQTVMGWREVTFLSRGGAAFELSRGSPGRRRVKGTLYVVPLSAFWGPRLSGLPTSRQPSGTSGMTVAVWTDNKDVYVMIVEGDQAAFESFFVEKFA